MAWGIHVLGATYAMFWVLSRLFRLGLIVLVSDDRLELVGLGVCLLNGNLSLCLGMVGSWWI